MNRNRIKVGDLIRLPQSLGYAIAIKVVSHHRADGMPTGDTAVMVEEGDWWDADVCMVMNESR